MEKHLEEIGVEVTSPDDPSLMKAVTQFVKEWMKSGYVPGYGHPILRATDPRYTYQKKLALKCVKDHKLVKLVHTCELVVPDILKKIGKVKNPNPNADSHTSALLSAAGITEIEFHVLFVSLSRIFGCLSNIILARALNLGIERPSSIDFDGFKKVIEKNN